MLRCAVLLLATGCSGQEPLLINNSYSGYIIASNGSASPSRVTLMSPKGDVVRELFAFSPGGYAAGHAFVPPNELIVYTETNQNFKSFNLDSWDSRNLLNPSVIGGTPVRQLAASTTDKSIYVIVGNHARVDKVVRNANGTHSVQYSFLTSSGVCVLSNPFAITWIASTKQIAVTNISSPFGIAIYNEDGTCATQLSAPPLDSTALYGLTYHALSNKLITSFGHTIYAVNLDGSGGEAIFLDSLQVSAPRALASDTTGNIFTSATGTNTIEKLYYSGSGSASRSSSGAFSGPSAYTVDLTAITVIP